MSLAAATLLGIVPKADAAKPVEQAPNHWTWDTSFMQYTESERMRVSEPQVGVRRELAGDRSLSILATVDTMSGATPLGTLPQTANTAPQTMTSPSGRAINPIIGKVPTSHMSDTRIAINASYERPVGISSRRIVGGNISKEHDFLSLGGDLTLNRDFNQKNTTLSIGLSPEYDRVSPNGGLPYAYGTQQSSSEFEGGHKNKYLLSSLMGLTQVINRKTLMQWNYSLTYENGYLNDPYKLLSLVNARGDPLSAIHEHRPGSRLEHSLYWLTRYTIWDQDVFSLGLRYYADDWGIHSQTIDFTYRWQYNPNHFFEPHVRYSHQSAADFFRIGLSDDQSLPDFASADYRLSAIDSISFGARMGWLLQNGSQLILRFEYYTQTGDSHPKTAVGLQKAYDLFPTLHATILQAQYTFDPRQLWTPKKSQ